MATHRNFEQLANATLKYACTTLDVLRVLLWCVCLVGLSVFRFFVPPRRKSVVGYHVLITGAANGMGRHLARNFAKLGAKVVLWDVDQESNLALQNEIRDHGGEAWAFQVDVSDEAQVEEVGLKVQRIIGNVDILINNAAVLPGKPIMLLNSYQIKKTLEINTLAHFWTIRQFLPNMIQNGEGHIVAVSSIAGFAGCTNMTDYCASKYGVIGFMSALREDLYVQGKEDVIQVTVACPPAMNTGMAQKPKTRFPAVFPIADPKDIADLITDGILRNKKMVMPFAFHLLFKFGSILPVEATIMGQRFLDYSIDPNVI